MTYADQINQLKEAYKSTAAEFSTKLQEVANEVFSIPVIAQADQNVTLAVESGQDHKITVYVNVSYRPPSVEDLMIVEELFVEAGVGSIRGISTYFSSIERLDYMILQGELVKQVKENGELVKLIEHYMLQLYIMKHKIDILTLKIKHDEKETKDQAAKQKYTGAYKNKAAMWKEDAQVLIGIAHELGFGCVRTKKAAVQRLSDKLLK